MDINNPNIQNNPSNIYSEFVVPVLPPEKKSNKRKILIIAGAGLLIVLVILAVVVSIKKPVNTASTNTEAAVTASGEVIKIIQSEDFAKLSDNLTDGSPFNTPGFSIIAINNSVGTVNYASCTLQTRESYETSTDIVNSINTEIVYVPYTCDIADGTEKRTVEFDMQRSVDIKNSDWKLNYIVSRGIES